jgi:hypothetical protein
MICLGILSNKKLPPWSVSKMADLVAMNWLHLLWTAKVKLRQGTLWFTDFRHSQLVLVHIYGTKKIFLKR